MKTHTCYMHVVEKMGWFKCFIFFSQVCVHTNAHTYTYINIYVGQ